MTMRWGVALVLAGVIAGASGQAAADVATARANYRRGAQLLAAGQALEAADAFRQAFRAEPVPQVLLAIARAYDRAGEREAAAAYYWWYLNSGAATADEQEWLFPRIVELRGGGAGPAKPAPNPANAATVPAPAAPKNGPTSEREAPDDPPEAAPPAAAPVELASSGAPRAPAADLAGEASTRDRGAPPSLVAQTIDDGPADQPPARKRWYGSTLLLAEGASFLVFAVGLSGGEDSAVALGALGMALSPIVVHARHDRAGVGIGGLLMRLGGAGLGALGGAEDGAIAGYLVAAAIDIVVLCREPVRPAAEPGVVPAGAFVPGGGVLGLAGVF